MVDQKARIWTIYCLNSLKKDQRVYKTYLRITLGLIQKLVEKLTPRLQKQSMFTREPLRVGLKLTVNFRFLDTGNSYPRLQHSFRVERSTICKFIPDVRKKPASRSTRTKC